MLKCLSASAPPINLLSQHPRIARLISTYSMSKNLGALPDPGGLLDQRADVYAFFAIFGNAESEHYRNSQQ